MKMKKKKMKSKQRGLPDDLVVEILSRVPLKSFCRFKCVCKAWLAFSSDPHYRRKLPKVPTGLLYRDQHVQLLSLSENPDDEELDTVMPDSKKLELLDCCNGLVLCRYKSRRDPSPDTSRLVVYNPVTREWRALPVASDPYDPQDTLDMIDEDDLTDSNLDYTTFLGFDPSWSAEFYVFSFQELLIRGINAGIMGLEVFDSDMSSCFVDDDGWMGESLVVGRAHIFVGGVLYMETYSNVILVVQGLEEMSRCKDYHSTIKLPDGCEVGVCFGQSLGLLQCALPEEGGRAIAVFSLDAACKWSMKHRFSMQDAFGRDEFVRSRGLYLPGFCDYQIIALDLEREVLLLLDKRPKKLLSYGINSGKLCEIKDGDRLLRCYFSHLDLDCHYYVACYSKLQR